MITIARLTPPDRAAWEALWRGYMAFYERTLPDAMYDSAWAAFLADERLHARGAWLDGQLVGLTHFLFHANTSGPDVCYLQDLFTAPAARGRGVGRALIQAVAAEARARACGRLYWMTHASNGDARALYDKLAENRGFIRYQIELA